MKQDDTISDKNEMLQVYNNNNEDGDSYDDGGNGNTAQIVLDSMYSGLKNLRKKRKENVEKGIYYDS